MAQDDLIPLNFAAGTQRDGTDLDGHRSLDAKWCRWRLGRPRKMGGYESISFAPNGTPRRIHMFYNGPDTYVHVGTSNSIEQFILDRDGKVTAHNNRTPAKFAAGPDVGWTIDALFDTGTKAVTLVAHPTSDLDFLSDQSRGFVLAGKINDTGKLAPINNPGGVDGEYTQPHLAGGIVGVQPYLMSFDTGGQVGWSAPNRPNTLGFSGGTSGAGAARISAQKIVQGMPLRGGAANSPAALFWSLSEVILAQFVGGGAAFSFNTVSPSSSILSSDCVIEYDGLYFWAGIDRFLVFNGTVAEIPNTQNQDWFFDNINRRFACKTFAFKVPRYGEIWWCAPLFDATEPSHAVIFNVRENVWYETALPSPGRSAGYCAQGLRFPVMGSPGDTKGTDAGLWLHEKGLDAITDGVPAPIESYFETPYLGGPAFDPPNSHALSFEVIEPDVVQTGDITITLAGKANARDLGSDNVETTTLKANASVPQEQTVGFKKSLRLPRLRFTSNTLGGNYVFGKTLMHVRQAGARTTGGSNATQGKSKP